MLRFIDQVTNLDYYQKTLHLAAENRTRACAYVAAYDAFRALNPRQSLSLRKKIEIFSFTLRKEGKIPGWEFLPRFFMCCRIVGIEIKSLSAHPKIVEDLRGCSKGIREGDMVIL